MSDVILAYGTAASMDEAKRISKTLLQEKLIACANLLPQMTSLYTWKGQTEEAQEVAFLLKTTRSKWNQLSHRYQELHKYETPCLMEIPVGSVLDVYSRWIQESL